MTKEQLSLLRRLPSVDDMLKETDIEILVREVPRNKVVQGIRLTIDRMRNDILSGKVNDFKHDDLVRDILVLIKKQAQPNLRPVINATGVVLHTNLGRAPLAESAQQAVSEIIKGYSNLELDLNTGKRGSRYSAVEGLLTTLTDAEAALVVNNNASAVLLALSTMAKDKEVVVSRGQLVEIGGSFRIPEVMEQSGAILVEVGTTNKTYPRDYERAITEQTGLLLNVHTSNYRIVGFTRETTIEELVALGTQYQLPVMCDLGSGFLVDLSEYGLPAEPTVQQVVKAGADIVTFSGDKLLGGPQAGIIIGKKQYIEKMKNNPLTRAVRIDKFTVAALEATLREYLQPDRVLKTIPTLRMLTEPAENLYQRAKELTELIMESVDQYAEVSWQKGYSRVGGGAMPTADMPTGLCVIRPKHITVSTLVERLRDGSPPVVARVHDQALLLDVRTIQPQDIEPLLATLLEALQSERGDS